MRMKGRSQNCLSVRLETAEVKCLLPGGGMRNKLVSMSFSPFHHYLWLALADFDAADNSCRDPCGYRTRRETLGDDSSGSNNTLIPDSDPFEDDCICADVDVVPDSNRCAVYMTVSYVLFLQILHRPPNRIVRVDLHSGRDAAMSTDPQSPAPVEQCEVPDPCLRPDSRLSNDYAEIIELSADSVDDSRQSAST